MTHEHKVKVIWIDFFGVICSEIAPFWFQKYFSEEESLLLKEKYFIPADVGDISNSELMNHLSKLVGKTAGELDKEFYSSVKINREVVAYLEKLKKTHTIILCSNASSIFLRTIIKDNNLGHLFDEIIISSEIKCRKPDNQFFDKCLQLSECPKEEIIFIDDNKVNIESAKNFGVQTILFTKSEDLLQMP
jgi:HAD superfamily hydrolase (TIGR01509 family)